MNRVCKVYNLRPYGPLNYAQVWAYQKVLMEQCWRRKKVDPDSTEDALILVEHQSVYTLGRGATVSNLKFDPKDATSPAVYRIERGGEVTWHGEGQLVAYPIFDLSHHKKDLHWFATSLEQVVIDTLQHYEITGERSSVNTGVWVKGNKISALGVTASRWITMHGIAINVCPNLQHFQHIIPCGIQSNLGGVCRVQDMTKKDIDMEMFSKNLQISFANLFRLQLQEEVNPLQALNSLQEKDFPEIQASQLIRLQ